MRDAVEETIAAYRPTNVQAACVEGIKDAASAY